MISAVIVGLIIGAVIFALGCKTGRWIIAVIAVGAVILYSGAVVIANHETGQMAEFNACVERTSMGAGYGSPCAAYLPEVK